MRDTPPAWLQAEKAELAQKARRERRQFYAQAEAMRQESLLRLCTEAKGVTHQILPDGRIRVQARK